MSIYVIGDTQAKKGVRNSLIPVAHHICDVRPDVIVHIGDAWDMPSLSKYDKGKKSHRVKSYLTDIRAGNKAMKEFFEILDKRWPKNKKECIKIIFKGNHEDRRNRALEYGPDELIELMNEFDFDYTGWDKVIPFLTIHEIDGILFTHYFSNINNNYAIGTARQLIARKHCSCVAGHKQGWEYHEETTEKNKRIQAIISGSTYFHNEDYKNHNNHHWRGITFLTNVHDCMYDFARYELKNLDRHYHGKYHYTLEPL